MNTNRIYMVLDEIKGDLKELREAQSSLKNEFTRYKGFWGGIIFTCTSIGALLGVVWSHFKEVF